MGEVIKNERVIHLINSIDEANHNYVAEHKEYLKELSHGQTPVATLVMCCDSRAHTTSFTYNPENNFFIVRNIGNQYILNQGCVEFGVRFLHTPLLMFLGHTRCGAVQASMSDYTELPSSIVREIDHLALSIQKAELHGDEDCKWSHAVINNVNKQVELAIKDFRDLIDKQELIVIGAVLDIDNSLKEGHGRISVTSINGNTNLDYIKKYPLFTSLMK